MILHRKIAPKGIDKNVDAIQVYLNSVVSALWDNVECFHRAYLEEETNGVKPMITFDGKNYKDVFFDTKKAGVIFFYEGSQREGATAELNIVFQLKLNVLYPSVTHRADEEVHNFIMAHLTPQANKNEIQLFTTIKQVYADFSTSQVLLDDIGAFHCFRVKLSNVKVNYCR